MDKLKNERAIVEGFFVSVIAAWGLLSTFRGTFGSINSLDSVAKANFPMIILLLAVLTAIMAGIYYKEKFIAKIVMFISVYIYAILCATSGDKVVWSKTNNNEIGDTCFMCMLCFITVLAFLYIKDEIMQLFGYIKLNGKIAKIFFVIIGILLFGIVAAGTIFRYKTYSSSTYDFGIFAQMYEYMKQTGKMTTTVERNTLLSHFGVHFSPIFYIGLPIYMIFPSAITVQVIQAIMVALPIIPIMLLCRHYKLSNWITVAVTLIYALYPATAGGTFYDIHENCFLTFFLLLTIYFVEKKKDILAIICMLLVFFVKEDAAAYIMIVGAYFLFSRRDKKRGIIMIILSAIYFVVALSVVNSYGLGVLDDRFANLYADPNGGLGQVFKTIIANPAYVIAQMISNADATGMDKIQYLLLMIVPMATMLFATGKKYSRYILMAPFLVFNVFTTYLYLHDVGFQYNFGVIALFMYLAIMNISEMDYKKARTVAGISVICTSIMFFGTTYPRINHYGEKYSTDKAKIEKINKGIEMVPRTASVAVSGFFMPHLSRNLDVYDQTHLKEVKEMEYLVVDERGQEEKEKFDEVLATGKYELIYHEDNLISVYHKKQ